MNEIGLLIGTSNKCISLDKRHVSRVYIVLHFWPMESAQDGGDVNENSPHYCEIIRLSKSWYFSRSHTRQ